MEKLKTLNIKMICICIILIFFLVPRAFQSAFKFLFLILFMYGNLIFVLKNKIKFRFNYSNIIKINLAFFGYLLICFITPYSIIFTTSTLMFLGMAYVCFTTNELDNLFSERAYKLVYFICLISIFVQLIRGDQNVINGKIALSILGDKNYSGVIMFLFFMYCDKRKFYLGKIVSIMSILILESRASLLIIIILLFTKVFKKIIYSSLKKIKLDKTYKLFIIMSIFSVIFSYFWTFNVAINGLKDYQEGLNDGSNKMRFAANVYAIEALKNDKKLLLYGYDEDFDKIAGIDSENRDYHTRFMGARLVQPHNSILNIFIKCGVLVSLVYFYVLSKLIDKKYNIDNIEYILSYFVSCLFLHRLLDGTFLILWAIILCIPVKKYNIQTRKKNR